jgi:hypothetical protein
MTLRDVFHNTKRGQLYRYLHFPGAASQWTLDMDVLVEEPDPDEPDNGPLIYPHPIVPGYHATILSSDIEHIVNYADTLSESTDDNVRLDALRYYYHHGRLVFENWHPPQQEGASC